MSRRKRGVRKVIKKAKKPVANAKVKNATKVTYDDIEFRSKLEMFMYKLLKENNFEFRYEKLKLILIEAFEFEGDKVREMSYLPDFLVDVGDVTYIVETKGRPNDVWPVKLKLLKRYIVEKKLNWHILIPGNQKECKEVIDLLISERGKIQLQ